MNWVEVACIAFATAFALACLYTAFWAWVQYRKALQMDAGELCPRCERPWKVCACPPHYL